MRRKVDPTGIQTYTNETRILEPEVKKRAQEFTDETYEMQLKGQPKDGSWEAYLQELENKIKDAYESSVTITEAEKLAGEFLVAQMKVNAKIRIIALDARMKKQGVKAIRASVYLEKARAVEKKPSDAMLEAEINRDPLVLSEQKSFDEAETETEMYQNYFRIFESAHVYFRLLSKSNG